MNQTIDYYEKNLDSFLDSTRYIDFSKIQNTFLACLKPGDSILDLGCGSGRDAAAFLAQGYPVTAVDGSFSMARAASMFLRIPVENRLFQDIDYQNAFEGVWACASLLHLNKEELEKVLLKIYTALKPGGVLYCSFKYGEFEGMRHGRFFLDLNQDSFESLLEKVNERLEKEEKGREFSIIKIWKSADERDDHKEEMWLNILLKKNS